MMTMPLKKDDDDDGDDYDDVNRNDHDNHDDDDDPPVSITIITEENGDSLFKLSAPG